LAEEKAMNGPGATFAEWVTLNASKVEEARKASTAELSTEPGPIANQLRHVRRHFVLMGYLLADAKTWTLKAHASATQEVRRKYPDYNGDERKAMAKSEDDYVKALHIEQMIETTASALKQMHFEILNGRRTTFPHAQSDTGA
jgi:hypothetical protein